MKGYDRVRALSATRTDPNTRKYNLNIIIRYAIKFIKIRPNKNHKSIQLRYVKNKYPRTSVFYFIKQKVYNAACGTLFKLYIPLTPIF